MEKTGYGQNTRGARSLWPDGEGWGGVNGRMTNRLRQPMRTSRATTL